jgi:[acyl-carrier-protein] S-malonyltransferase
LKAEGINAEVAGGHSLGEYSALVATGSLKFRDAVLLVHKRGQFMQEAVPVGEGSMAAIIGLDDQVIVDACNEISVTDAVQAVNFNCPGQTVIAGTTKGVDAAVEKLKAAGAKKAVVLPVSAPFHSTLMKPAAEKLSAELDKIEIKDAAFPIAANFNGKIETSAAEIKNNLVAQADHPVKWIDCVKAMQDLGADTFIECGPGKTLCGFNRRIDKQIKSLNVENIESLKKTIEELKNV